MRVLAVLCWFKAQPPSQHTNVTPSSKRFDSLNINLQKGGEPSNKTNKHKQALSGDVSVLPFCIERTVFFKGLHGWKKNLHRSIEKNDIIECKAHTKKMQPSERVICPDIECLIIHSLWGRLSQTVCATRFHFWMLGFLLVLFCLWILIPTVRFLITKCQIRGSQAEKSSFQPKLILQRCDGLFNWPYVQDFCMWAILTPCLWFCDACVWCVQQSMCVVMRFCLFLTHCAAVVWEIASVYTFTV